MASGKINRIVSALYGLSQLIGVIPSSEVIDFDTEQRFCIYFNAANSTGTKPFSTNGYLFTIVRDPEGTVLQIAFPANINAENPKIRTSVVGTFWREWKTITLS